MRRFLLMFVLILPGAVASAEGVSPFAEALYWHASEETSSVWASVVSGAGSTSTFAASQIQFDWDAGLRTGFLFEPEDSPWDAKLSWTHFVTSQDLAINGGDHLVVPEFFSGFLSGDAFLFTNAAIDWQLAFNTIDLDVGHELVIGESLTLRPAVGIKAAVITQTIRSQWSDPILLLSATENVDHDFWALGPDFGISAYFDVPQVDGLRLVGSFSGAFLYGSWDVTDVFQRTDPFVAPNATRTFTTSLQNSSLGTLMLRYFVGGEWTWSGPAEVTARVGYELQWWANQQRLPTFQQLPMHGDLTLQGLTCGLSISF